MMNTTTHFVVEAPNVAELFDEDINILVDLHLFSVASSACTGRLRYHYVSDGGNGTTGEPSWQCNECGAVLRSTQEKHSRAVKDYCADMGLAWRIVEKIKTLDAMTQVSFELRLQAQYHCNVLGLTGRMIAIAALQALGAVDYAGYVVEKSEARR